MSLYALFPGNDPLTTSTSRPTTASACGTTCNNPSLYRPASPVSATEFGARCVVVDISTMKTGKKRQINRSDSFSTTDTTEALSMSSSSSSLQDSHTTTTTATATTTNIKHDQQLKIQVENIKINFNKLCRASGKSSSSCHDSKSNHTKKRSFSVSRSPRDGRLRRRSCSRSNTRSNASAEQDNLTSYEKAIELDLNIRYGGRSYTAKRSLNQIAQLRQDLLEEMSYHHHAMDHLLDESSTGSSDLLLDGSYRSSSSSIGGSSRSCEDVNTVIPSLPRLSSETASAGSSSSSCMMGGFAQINGMMQAYRPALESWFQQTTTSPTSLVSEDNPVLANFLWEPLSSSSSSSSLLGSMHES